jgi:hypothetical protein
MVFLPITTRPIYGLSVYEDETALALEKLNSLLESDLGGIACEEPPPDNNG